MSTSFGWQTSVIFSYKKSRELTKRVLFVFSPMTDYTAVILPNSAIDTIPKTLIHSYSYLVVAPHVKIDKEAAVRSVRNKLEEIHHLAAKREPAILRCHGDGSNMAMPFHTLSFSLAYD